MTLEDLGVKLNYPDFKPCSGKLLIVASGRCVWDDLERYARDQEIHFNGDVMAVNDVGMHLPCELTHWYSNDWKMLPKWVEARRPRFKKKYGPVQTHSCYGGAKYVWPWPGHGTSSLNAVYTGLALGYDEIVLAGVPLDNSGHYFDPPWVNSNFSNEVPNKGGQLRYWNRQIFEGKVKSLSGRTRELLGSP